MGRRIRAAAVDDRDAIRRIVSLAYAPYLARGLDLPPVTEGLDLDIRDNIVRVAELDGTLVGCAVMVLAGDHLKLANLAVSPEASGQGIGGALLQAAEAEMQRRGLDALRLVTHSEMADTISFYARLGFRETGRDGVRVFMER